VLARSFAMQGAKVVVNDLAKGGGVDAGTREGANQEKRITSCAQLAPAEPAPLRRVPITP